MTNEQTEGDLLFEAYLESVSLPFGFDEDVAGTTKKPDYRVEVGGETARFEVKQFERASGRGRPNRFDFCGPVREKINQSAKQFKGLSGSSCCLVLYNQGRALAGLGPLTIFSAMLGDPMAFWTINTEARVATEPMNVFHGGGKMVRRYQTEAQPAEGMNTTISAIIVVSMLRVCDRRFEIEAKRRECSLGRPLSTDERWNMSDGFADDAAVVRVGVHDNPFAAKPLTPDFGRGPWDQRFRLDAQGRLVRAVVGSALEGLEAIEKGLGINVPVIAVATD